MDEDIIKSKQRLDKSSDNVLYEDFYDSENEREDFQDEDNIEINNLYDYLFELKMYEKYSNYIKDYKEYIDFFCLEKMGNINKFNVYDILESFCGYN